MKQKIKLEEEYTNKEKEKLELTNKLFNTNFDNNRILFDHLITQLYIICFILSVVIIGANLL